MSDGWQPPPHWPRHAAELDTDRVSRRGFAEAVYGEGKSVDQLREIASSLAADPPGAVTLFTRMSPEKAGAVVPLLPDAAHDPVARLVAWPGCPPAVTGGTVTVVAAGSSDLPVAREAAVTATFLGRSTELVVDVGVAGLARVLSRVELLRRSDAIVVVAGMDGALPSVIAGLVAAPVVAVPTSIGYGASFGGLGPLLAMLNACAPGVAVVNIDNGFGAGHFAAQITAATRPR